jgi:WD40 repeat protein
MTLLDDGHLVIVRDRQLLISHQLPANATAGLTLSSAGTSAILVTEGTNIRCWDLSQSNPAWSDYNVPTTLTRISLSASGETFVASTDQGHMGLYNAKSGQRIQSIQGVGTVKSELVVSDDGAWLAFAETQSVSLCEMHSFQRMWQAPLSHSYDQQQVAISADGHRVSVGNCRMGIEILNGLDGKSVCRIATDYPPHQLEFSSAGDALYMSNVSDGSIRVWTLPNQPHQKAIEKILKIARNREPREVDR